MSVGNNLFLIEQAISICESAGLSHFSSQFQVQAKDVAESIIPKLIVEISKDVAANKISHPDQLYLPYQYSTLAQRLRKVAITPMMQKIALTMEMLTLSFKQTSMVNRNITQHNEAYHYLVQNKASSYVYYLNSEDGLIYCMYQDTYAYSSLTNEELQKVVSCCQSLYLPSFPAFPVALCESSDATQNRSQQDPQATYVHTEASQLDASPYFSGHIFYYNDWPQNTMLNNGQAQRDRELLNRLIRFDERLIVDDQGLVVPKKKERHSPNYTHFRLTQETLLTMLRSVDQAINAGPPIILPRAITLVDDANHEAIFYPYLSWKNALSVPQVTIYRADAGQAPLASGTHGKVYRMIKVTTGSKVVAKIPNATKGPEAYAKNCLELQYEAYCGDRIHNFINSNKELIKTYVGKELFINKNGKEYFVGIVKNKYFDSTNSPMLYLNEGAPLVRSAYEQQNYRWCLQYHAAHYVLALCGFLQIDAKIHNTILVDPFENGSQQFPQIIDLGGLVPLDDEGLHRYILANKESRSYIDGFVSTYQNPLLSYAVKIKFKEYSSTLSAEQQREKLAEIRELFHNHVFFMQMLVFLQLAGKPIGRPFPFQLADMNAILRNMVPPKNRIMIFPNEMPNLLPQQQIIDNLYNYCKTSYRDDPILNNLFAMAADPSCSKERFNATLQYLINKTDIR